MIKYWEITAYCVNEKGQRKSFKAECKNVFEISRVCSCMKITRGYEVLEYRVVNTAKLF